jgi:xanthine dehydrogenase accessory factor
MIKGELTARVARLTAERVPFAIATVVRARRPTSVRPGDSAVVLADGTIEGFVGGACAESTVRLYSLRAMETGEPLLLRLVPGDGGTEAGRAGTESGRGGTEEDDSIGIEGAVVEHNPCLSGGSLEIFLEPQLPAARIVVVGSAPIAAAVAGLAATGGYDVVRGAADEVHLAASDAAVIVAAHGSDEQRVLSEALAAGVPYVALVASSERGEAVRGELDVPEQLRAQLHTPAGLDIGARTPAEIAISILAEMVAQAHAHPDRGAVLPAAASAESAVDPMCGMRVAVTDSTPSLELAGGERAYFCGAGCRDAYAARHVEHG